MSGPKVVRIVTVEEIREICHGHLARLRTALERWEKVGNRNDLIEEADIKEMRQRFSQIEALMAKGQYLDLQKRSPDEISWIEKDLARRLEEAQHKAADARKRERRRAAFAYDLLERSLGGANELPAALRVELEAIAKGSQIENTRAEAALGEALRWRVTEPARQALTEEKRALAARLGRGLESASFDTWLEHHEVPTDEMLVEDRVAAAIETLRLIGAISYADKFASMLVNAGGRSSEANRRMRLDTILIEISRATTEVKAGQKRLFELEAAMAEARTTKAFSGSELALRAAAALANQTAQLAPGLIEQVLEFTTEERKKTAAKARRAAMLAALAETGYEVREGMNAATTVAGTMVLRRAANPEMGVEVSGVTTGDRLQVRPVRFATPGTTGDSSKDRDIETIWCSDFDRLRKSVAAARGELVLERALPIGATPVMVIADVALATERTRVQIEMPRNLTVK